MKKRIFKIIFLSLLAALVLGAALICVTQWDNIQSAILALKHDEEELDAMHTDVKADFTEKTGIDLDAIEAMASNMMPEGTSVDPDTSNEAADHANTNTPSSAKPSDWLSGNPPARDTSKIQEILARFYVLRSTYTSSLNTIKSDAYAQYKALPKEERGTAAKVRIGRNAVSRATALESECDAKITALLKELRAALRDAGMDETIAKDVEYYYASEKSLMKAQYMSKYKKYLT